MPVAHRFQRFGTSIFSEMTRLAMDRNAVNLSQGFPDFDGPDFVKQAAIEAINDGRNQYAPMPGIYSLREAVARRWEKNTGQAIDPATQIAVTDGCTEGIAAACIGLLNPGDEVIIFEPYYDSYIPSITTAGATHRTVTLHAPDFHFDRDQLRSAINGRTRAIIINTPHNPSGKVYTREELEFIAALCIEHDIIAITDEVYEYLTFDDAPHVRIATLPGMADRTITLSSIAKTFSLTGWKIGYAVASADLAAAVRAGRQFSTFSVATPLQHAAATALDAPDSYFDQFRAQYHARRDRLCSALAEIGFVVYPPRGTYFVLCDHTPFGFEDDRAFCRYLVEEIGVAAIPPTPFYDHVEHGRPLVRFAFCKTMDTLDAAIDRLQKLRKK